MNVVKVVPKWNMVRNIGYFSAIGWRVKELSEKSIVFEREGREAVFDFRKQKYVAISHLSSNNNFLLLSAWNMGNGFNKVLSSSEVAKIIFANPKLILCTPVVKKERSGATITIVPIVENKGNNLSVKLVWSSYEFREVIRNVSARVEVLRNVLNNVFQPSSVKSSQKNAEVVGFIVKKKTKKQGRRIVSFEIWYPVVEVGNEKYIVTEKHYYRFEFAVKFVGRKFVQQRMSIEQFLAKSNVDEIKENLNRLLSEVKA